MVKLMRAVALTHSLGLEHCTLLVNVTIPTRYCIFTIEAHKKNITDLRKSGITHTKFLRICIFNTPYL